MKKLVVVLVAAILLTTMSCFTTQADEQIECPYKQMFIEVGERYNISPCLLMAISYQESRWKPNVSNGNCVGLMGVNKVIHAERMKKLGITNVYDPYSNIVLGADIIQELIETKGTDEPSYILDLYNGNSRALANYNAGKFSTYSKDILERSRRYELVMYGM